MRRDLYDNGGNPFYHSAEWDRMKKRVLRRDGYMDVWLKRYGRMVPAEIVHHVFLLEERPDLRLDPHNLVSVSKATHNKLHNPDGSLSDDGIALQRLIAKKYGIKT